jgi:hypothetical protein
MDTNIWSSLKPSVASFINLKTNAKYRGKNTPDLRISIQKINFFRVLQALILHLWAMVKTHTILRVTQQQNSA